MRPCGMTLPKKLKPKKVDAAAAAAAAVVVLIPLEQLLGIGSGLVLSVLCLQILLSNSP